MQKQIRILIASYLSSNERGVCAIECIKSIVKSIENSKYKDSCKIIIAYCIDENIKDVYLDVCSNLSILSNSIIHSIKFNERKYQIEHLYHLSQLIFEDDIIMFCDDDDLYHPDKIDIIVDKFFECLNDSCLDCIEKKISEDLRGNEKDMENIKKKIIPDSEKNIIHDSEKNIIHKDINKNLDFVVRHKIGFFGSIFKGPIITYDDLIREVNGMTIETSEMSETNKMNETSETNKMSELSETNKTNKIISNYLMHEEIYREFYSFCVYGKTLKSFFENYNFEESKNIIGKYDIILDNYFQNLNVILINKVLLYHRMQSIKRDWNT